MSNHVNTSFFAVFYLVYVQFTNAYYNVGYQRAVKKLCD